MFFTPAATWDANHQFYDKHYGSWSVGQSWIDADWPADPGQDWGILLIPPDAQGNYPGDYTGVWSATSGISYGDGAHGYLSGYPGQGEIGSIHNSFGQAFCNSTWNLGDIQVVPELTGSNVGVVWACNMNPGSSGGPVFIELSNGTWTIGGVVNQGGPDRDRTQWLVSMYFDDRLVEFYRAVVASLGR